AAPVAPAGPWAPAGPCRMTPGARSVLLTCLSAITRELTAPVLSAALPTLRGASVTAAQLVPPSATRSATDAITIAGEGLNLPRLLIKSPLFRSSGLGFRPRLLHAEDAERGLGDGRVQGRRDAES